MDGEIKILLVDDEELVLRSMEKTLLRAGFNVETARDAGSGQTLFQAATDAQDPFDIAILDLNMPDLNGQTGPDVGLVLLDRLLDLDAGLPVVILTAFDDVGRAKEAVARGASAYFVKGREAGLVDLVKGLMSAA